MGESKKNLLPKYHAGCTFHTQQWAGEVMLAHHMLQQACSIQWQPFTSLLIPVAYWSFTFMIFYVLWLNDDDDNDSNITHNNITTSVLIQATRPIKTTVYAVTEDRQIQTQKQTARSWYNLHTTYSIQLKCLTIALEQLQKLLLKTTLLLCIIVLKQGKSKSNRICVTMSLRLNPKNIFKHLL